MGPHPDLELSAYVDDALDGSERARVAAHIANCSACAARARELSATVALLRALPDPRPRRSLVPPFTRVPAWYAPARLLSGIASGAFALLFVAAALGALGSPRGATTAAAPAGAPREPATGAAGVAPAAGASASDAAESAQRHDSAPSPSAVPRPAQPAPSVFTVPATPAGTSPEAGPTRPLPLLWLGLALAAAAAAAVLHVRMRAG